MKQISVPAPIILHDPVSGDRAVEVGPGGVPVAIKPVTFASHVIRQWLNAPAFSDAEGIVALLRLVPTVKDAMVGGFWTVEDDDHRRLLIAMDAPNAQVGWVPTIAMQLLPFGKAVRDATTVDSVGTR